MFGLGVPGIPPEADVGLVDRSNGRNGSTAEVWLGVK